jgi:HlyD family secretion protein
MVLLGTIRLVAAAPQDSGPIENVFCPMEGKNIVLYIVPEGGRVAKGQLVCSLGPAGSRARLVPQQISTRKAEASYQEGKLAREAAEVAVREYEERTFKRQLKEADADIALAEAELQSARDRVERWTKVLHCTLGSESQQLSDRLAVNKAKSTLQESAYRKKMLLEFTKRKSILQLRAEVEQARVQELSRLAAYEREKRREEQLRGRSGKVQVLAPIDGSVRYARPTSLVEEGAEVCEGQLLLRIVPDSKVTPAKL